MPATSKRNEHIAFRGDNHVQSFATREDAVRFVESEGQRNKLWRLTTRTEVLAAKDAAYKRIVVQA